MVNDQNYGEFWKIQDVKTSNLSLDIQIDAFLAEIFKVKVAYPTLKLFRFDNL